MKHTVGTNKATIICVPRPICIREHLKCEGAAARQ